MKPRVLASALTMIAAIGSGVALTVANGLAEQAAPPAATERHVFSPADRDAFLDARIAALHAGLRLTPEQEKLWPGVEAALRKAGRDAIERVQKFKESPATENLIERLKRRGENAVARGQNLQAIASAAAPLYATLSDEQKHRLPVLMHALRSHFLHHRFAMMDDFREHWGWRRGDWDEPRGFAPEESEHPSPKER